jgi:hypothetical protein
MISMALLSFKEPGPSRSTDDILKNPKGVSADDLLNIGFGVAPFDKTPRDVPRFDASLTAWKGFSSFRG